MSTESERDRLEEEFHLALAGVATFARILSDGALEPHRDSDYFRVHVDAMRHLREALADSERLAEAYAAALRQKGPGP